MCTALTLKTQNSYFGRNLDLEYSYNETVTITPRNYPLVFRKLNTLTNHFAMIGMAFVKDNYPLYYDAVNEHGLAMAGLNFPDNAVYYGEVSGKNNVTPFEFIPYVLGQYKTVGEVKTALQNTNLVNIPFSESLPLSPLHWIISDMEKSICVETTFEGMKIYDNDFGVLTNNPPFDFMKNYVTLFRDLSAEESENRFLKGLDLPVYCRGIAARGLPGDYSSVSRFVKAAFLRANSFCGDSEEESVGQFFHILGAVEMPRGAVHVHDEIYDITFYSSCCNQDKGIYYYTTYSNRQITAIDMHREDLSSSKLVSYPLNRKESINFQNSY